MGDGSGMLILEEMNFARDRGATILAEVVGYGSTADAFHVTEPPPDGGGIGGGNASRTAKSRVAT